MTKTKKTKGPAVRKLSRFWSALGVKRVVIKSPEEHDRIVTEMSHLPHVAAVALIASASDRSLEFASTGFKDTTRIAASDPDVWRDICITNKVNIVRSLDRYERCLGKLKKLIKDNKAEALRKEFAKSKAIREKLN